MDQFSSVMDRNVLYFPIVFGGDYRLLAGHPHGRFDAEVEQKSIAGLKFSSGPS